MAVVSPPKFVTTVDASEKQMYDFTDFDGLCLLVQKQHDELVETRRLCEEANKRITDQLNETGMLKHSWDKSKHATNYAEKTVQNRNAELKSVKSQILALEAKVRINKARTTALEVELEKGKARGRACETNVVELKQLLIDQDLQLSAQANADLYTTAQNQSVDEQADLPPQPFIVVLIDGDGHRFVNRNKNAVLTGTENAYRLRTEIQKYIMSHPHLPPHSKIVVRLFYNGATYTGSPFVMDMYQKFAETYPLFDFIECGRGKERADSILHANFHLYLHDTNCHAVFLAVGNDNGYARMLEGYECSLGARSKIVLLAAGEVVREIDRLPFTKVELTDVFEPLRYTKLRSPRRVRDVALLDKHRKTITPTSNFNTGDQINNLLDEMREERQRRQELEQSGPLVPRLPYEADVVYEKRVRQIMFTKKEAHSHARNRITSSSIVTRGFFCSFDHPQLKGVLCPTAPLLPFILNIDSHASTTYYDLGTASVDLEEADIE